MSKSANMILWRSWNW